MAPSAPNWTVEYQIAKVGLGPDGKAVQGVDVGFVTAKGVHNAVFIPLARFSPEFVKAAVAEWVAKHDAVSGLTG